MRYFILTTCLIIILTSTKSIAQINPNWTNPVLAVDKFDPAANAEGKVGNNMVVASDSNVVYIFYSEKPGGLFGQVLKMEGKVGPGKLPIPGIDAMIGLARISAAINTHNNLHVIWQSRGPDYGIFYSKRDQSTGL